MSAAVAFSVKTAGSTAYRVFVLVRGDDDYDLEWRFIGEHKSHSRAAVALDEWRLENSDWPAGRYRIESPDGYSVTRSYTGEEFAA